MVRKRDKTGGSDDKRGRIAVGQDNPLPPSPRRASERTRRRRRRARVAEHPPTPRKRTQTLKNMCDDHGQHRAQAQIRDPASATLADRPLSGPGATERRRRARRRLGRPSRGGGGANGSCAPVFTCYAYREDDRHATALNLRQMRRGVCEKFEERTTFSHPSLSHPSLQYVVAYRVWRI